MWKSFDSEKKHSTGLRFEEIQINSKGTLLCDTSTGVIRPLVPVNWRLVIESVHSLSDIQTFALRANSSRGNSSGSASPKTLLFGLVPALPATMEYITSRTSAPVRFQTTSEAFPTHSHRHCGSIAIIARIYAPTHHR